MNAITSTGTFGNIHQDGTSFRASVKSSLGIDNSELIDAMMKVKEVPLDRNKDVIAKNTQKMAAYGELKTKSQALESSLAPLRKENMYKMSYDAFNQKQVVVAGSGANQATNLMSMTTGVSTPLSSYTLEINRIAKNDVINSTGTFPDTDITTPITIDGDLVIPKADGSGNEIVSLATTDTLGEIITKINAVKTTTNVFATAVKIDETTYRLSLQNTDTGKAINIDTNSTASILTDLGISNSGQTDQDLSAELVFNGMTLYRSTNKVSDLVTESTIDLLGAEPGNTISIQVQRDLLPMNNSIHDWVTAHNDFMDFYLDQKKVEFNEDQSEVLEKSVLNNDPVLRDTYNNLMNVLSVAVKGLASNSEFNDPSDIGITFDNNKKLVIDEEKLAASIQNDFTKVERFFGLNFDLSSTDMSMVSWPNDLNPALEGNPVTVRITASDASGVPTAAEYEVTIGIDTFIEAATIDNGFIKGGATSAYFKDFLIQYTGGQEIPPAATFAETFTTVRGVADGINGGAILYVLAPKENYGLIETELATLTERNTNLTEKNQQIQRSIDHKKTILIEKFRRADQLIYQMEIIKKQMKAQMKAFRSM